MQFQKQSALYGAAVLIAALGTAGAAQALDPSDLGELRGEAVALLQEQGEEAAIGILGDPENGALELAESGLHSWGIDGDGVIIWDHSGQASPGLDVSGFEGPDGTNYAQDVVHQVKEGDGEMIWEGFPHPTTNEVGAPNLSCAEFATDRYVCVMAWF